MCVYVKVHSNFRFVVISFKSYSYIVYPILFSLRMYYIDDFNIYFLIQISKLYFYLIIAFLPTRSGKSLIYPLALVTYYVVLIGCRSIQLSEEAFFSWFG